MSAAALPSARVRSRGRLSALWGPGLIVMLADTDAGCLITAAQSGAQWGYAMVLPQIALIPILFMVQEITVRLGVVTGKGHGTLIREHFGTGWAWFSGATLFISAIGALLTEFVGVAGVGELFGIPRTVTIPVATAALVGVCFTRGYARVERIGIVVGLGELAFIPAMLLAHPRWSDLSHGLRQFPVHHASYLFLLAANIGAVVMPWMIFYQQSAIVDKGLRRDQLADERRDTAVGSVLTQVIMIVVVVAFAATVFTTRRGAPLNSVADLAHGLAPATGTGVADVLAGSWGLAEVLRWRHSLNESLNRGNWKFYAVYILAHVVGAVLVLASVDLVSLAVDVEVMNALLLPVTLTFLLLLEAKALPAEYRMHGPYRWVCTGLSVVVIGFGLYMIPQALGW